MATWTAISNPAVAVGGIPSSVTVTALRDNPEAMAEAATGAPVIFAGWHPVDKLTIGDGKDGLIYNHAVDGNVLSRVSPDFADGYEYKFLVLGLSHNGGGGANNLRVQVDTTGGGSYVTISDLAVASGSSISYELEFIAPRIADANVFAIFRNKTAATTTILNTALGSSVKIFKVRFITDEPSFGFLDAGKIWMFRRREYASSP
jgi:hypothetical protein